MKVRDHLLVPCLIVRTLFGRFQKFLFQHFLGMENDIDDVIVLYWFWRRRRKRRAAPFRWVRPFIAQRDAQGAFNNLVSEMGANDIDKFTNFHRMNPQQIDYLLGRISPLIQKHDVTRESVSPALRLSLTLRYLASGDSMVSLHYLYRVGKATITRIIPETCDALWTSLHDDVLKVPSNETWKKIAEDFGNRWDFPNCVGAIDGKHVIVQAFRNAGSMFYNYKNSHSIVLMAVCDAQYLFIYVSIGAAGRESDGGVFENTIMGRNLLDGTLPLPGFTALPGSNLQAPHVFVADAAFPLRENLLRPGTNLHASKTIFNYRLSRARRVIENTFGVLANKFRIFRKAIIAKVETAESIVKAAVVLHNWLRQADLDVGPGQRRYMPHGLVDVEDRDGNIEPGSWRQDGPALGLQGIPATLFRNPTLRAKEVQDTFREYFMTGRQVPFQWRKLPEHERQLYSEEAGMVKNKFEGLATMYNL